MMFPSSRTLPGKSYVFKIRCASRSEEHTSELQSQSNLVCRLLLEKKKVGAQAEPRDRRREATDEPAVRRQVVRPPHASQDAVAPALERDVKMRRDDRRARHDLQQLGGEVGWQDRGQSDRTEPRNVGEPAEERREGGPRNEVSAVMARVDPGQHDLGMAGLDEQARLVEHHLGLEAPAGTSGEGHDTEGAAVLAAVLDFEKGARLAVDPRQRCHVERRRVGDVPNVDALGDVALEQVGQPMLVRVTDDQIHLAEPGDVVRARLGPAAGHDEPRARTHPGRAPDRLAVGELGARSHRARVHHDHVGRLAEGHRLEPARLEHRLELLRVHLVEPAAEGRERDGARAHAGIGSLSWPHAAPMSSPLLHRTVVVISASSRIDWNARIRASGGRPDGDPDPWLKGIRVTFARTPRRSRTRRRASSGESLIPSSMTYSKKTRWRGASGYFLTAATSVSTLHERLTGMSCDRTSSDAAWSEIARFTLRFSRPSFSIPGTSPTVETVIRRGE